MRAKPVSVIAWIAVGLIVAAAAVLAVPRLLNGTTLTILTGSMQPTLRPGDVIAVVPVDDADLRVGDIVTFQPVSGDPTLVTHRLTSIDDSGEQRLFVTRGDANSADDASLQAAQIQGRMLYAIPFLGWLSIALGPAVPAIVAVSAIILIVFGTVAALRPAPSRAKRKALS